MMFAGVKTEEYGIYNSSNLQLAQGDKIANPVALSGQNLLS